MELELSHVIDSLPDLVWIAQPEGRVELVNHRWCEYTGQRRDEATGAGWQAAAHPEDRPRLLECWRSSLESGQPGEVQARLRSGSGSFRWFLFRANPMRDEAGISRWFGSHVDIEDRKRSEEALRANEHNLSLILNTIPTSIHVLGTDGSVRYVNRAVLDYTGFVLEDVQKANYRARLFHPEDLLRVHEERLAALRRPVSFELELRTRRNDGSYRWFLNRYSPLLDEQGSIDCWYVASFDIEDRRRAEAQLEQAYLRLTEAQRLSKTGSFVTDLQADHHDWSEEAFRIFDFDAKTKVSVQMIRDLVHAEDLPSFDAGIERSMKGEDFDLVFRIRTAVGNNKYLHAVARVIQHLEDRPLFIGALRDVTESVLAEQALSKARTDLAHASRIMTLGTLTASIAHEVNQPLSGIITNANTCLRMLAADPPNLDGARAATQRTLRDGNRAADVIQRLRTLFTHKQPRYEPVDLNEATREVLALSMSELQRAQVTLRTDFDESLPAVNGDRVQLQQVLLNLILNAADAMREVADRSRDLSIATSREEPKEARLSVRDSGIGIDPQKLEKVFDAFYTTKVTGMGIGLSISRSIIQDHRGRLWAAANDGPGATFSFCIPCGSEPLVRSPS